MPINPMDSISPQTDPTTGEEIASTTIPSTSDSSQKRNAFTELLSPSKKRPSSKDPQLASSKSTTLTTFTGRSGLGAYLQAPESFPPSVVLNYNDKFVTLHDKFPKSSVHTLLLPRDPKKQHLHPLEALSEDAEFLSSVKAEVEKLKDLVAKELRRRFGKYSAREKERDKALEVALDEDVDKATSSLPPGRDWRKEVIAGVHTHPSMLHLHIHVLSVDRHSEFLRHRKHYNSFATPFFVDLDRFPMTKEDIRCQLHEKYLKSDLVCWRCERNFGIKFAMLKAHLETEFHEWKVE